jgi:hypothetical protein
MTKCEHPFGQVEFDEAGKWSFSFDGTTDNICPVYFCKQCRQVVDEKDLPWLHEPSGVEQEPIPL